MAEITTIAATTAAVAYTACVPVNTAAYSHVTVAAYPALAGAEEVDVYMVVGPGVLAVSDSSGAVKKLTATVQMLELTSGPTYLFAKDDTSGTSAKGVYVTLGNLQ